MILIEIKIETHYLKKKSLISQEKPQKFKQIQIHSMAFGPITNTYGFSSCFSFFFFSKCYNRIKMFIFCLSKITCMFISDRVHAKYRFNDGPWSTSLTDSTFGWPIQSWSKISIINGFDVWMTTWNLMLDNVKNNHLIKPWLWCNLRLVINQQSTDNFASWICNFFVT